MNLRLNESSESIQLLIHKDSHCLSSSVHTIHPKYDFSHFQFGADRVDRMHTTCFTKIWAVVGLMDRALDLKPEANGRLWVRIPAPTASPRLLPGRCTVGCPLLQVCTLGWVKCREHISLLIILCIIVYVTNKAHPSLICICCTLGCRDLLCSRMNQPFE